jgi:hypothetical protein
MAYLQDRDRRARIYVCGDRITVYTGSFLASVELGRKSDHRFQHRDFRTWADALSYVGDRGVQYVRTVAKPAGR